MKDIWDTWTDISWEVVTDIEVAPIGGGVDECAVHISGSGYQRIICMTPNRGLADLICALLKEMQKQY